MFIVEISESVQNIGAVKARLREYGLDCMSVLHTRLTNPCNFSPDMSGVYIIPGYVLGLHPNYTDDLVLDMIDSGIEVIIGPEHDECDPFLSDCELYGLTLRRTLSSLDDLSVWDENVNEVIKSQFSEQTERWVTAGDCYVRLLIDDTLTIRDAYGLIYLVLIRGRALRSELPFVPFLALGCAASLIITQTIKMEGLF